MTVSANAPAPGLRGDYSHMRPDWTVDQPVEAYTRAQHELWRTLYDRQTRLVRDLAAPEFLRGLAAMECSEGIPAFEELSRRLRLATGWEIVAAPGLLPDDAFFALLAARRFPASWWLRDPEEIDYLVEPDVFHDVFGHAPLLFDPVFADYLQLYGLGGPKAIAHNATGLLARLYWYMVEFGLVMTPEGLKAYGAGMLSSFGETRYSVLDPAPNRVWFGLERVMRTSYRIDRYQSTYFVLEDFGQLFRECQVDFAALYQRIGPLPPLAPEAVLAEDRVLHRGLAPESGGA